MSPHGSGVLDTGVVIVLGSLDPGVLPREPLITAVTLAELSVGPLVAKAARERASRQARLQEVESAFDPLPLDAAAARTFGRVAAQIRAAGREVRPRAFDALIAAIAIANDLPLYTCNPRDFASIEDLDVVEVAQPTS